MQRRVSAVWAYPHSSPPFLCIPVSPAGWSAPRATVGPKCRTDATLHTAARGVPSSGLGNFTHGLPRLCISTSSIEQQLTIHPLSPLSALSSFACLTTLPLLSRLRSTHASQTMLTYYSCDSGGAMCTMSLWLAQLLWFSALLPVHCFLVLYLIGISDCLRIFSDYRHSAGKL